MRVKIKSAGQESVGTVWVNTMPGIVMPGMEPGGRTTEVPMSIDINEPLPEGMYRVEVTLVGPDGAERKAQTELLVRHAN